MPPTPQRHVELYDYPKTGRTYNVDAELAYEDGSTELMIKEYLRLQYMCEQMKRRAA